MKNNNFKLFKYIMNKYLNEIYDTEKRNFK